jgi:hypothetical protein
MLGFRYNDDLMTDEMEALLTQTRQALESLSSRVPLLVVRIPPSGAREE